MVDDASIRTWYAAGVRSVLLATLAGVLYFLGFAGFGFWPLAFLFLTTLLWAIEGKSVRQAFLLGAWAGFVAMCGGYYWVIHLLKSFANLSLPLALLGYVLLNLYQGMLWGVVAALVAWARRRLHMHPAWALPPAVMFTEWGFPLLFPSFVAASFHEIPWLTQIADLGGAYLVDGFIAVVSGGIFTLLPASVAARGRSWRPIGVAAGALVFTVVYSGVRMAQVDAELEGAREISVALIQANLGAAQKTTHRREFLLRHQQMSKAAIEARPDLDLVVWPEAAFNRAIPRSVDNVSQYITVGIHKPVLSGAITIERTGDQRLVFNSAVLTSSTGEIRGVFDKVRLLAFGETIPLVDSFPWLKAWFPRTGRFDRGQTFEHLELHDGTKMLPMICYEDLIPSFVRQMWRASGPADVLVNVTNDSWYGDTHEPRIHLALAKMRSIETRRSLIRSTNTGISAAIDPAGRVIKQAGQWRQEILFAEVPLIESGGTSVYMRLGDWAAWLSGLLFVGLWLWKRRRSD